MEKHQLGSEVFVKMLERVFSLLRSPWLSSVLYLFILRRKQSSAMLLPEVTQPLSRCHFTQTVS